MKKLIFNIVLLTMLPVCVWGQENPKYEQRVNKYRSFWHSLIPSYNKIQYAGSMGFLSFGAGWDYGKRDQWETEFFIGFLPKFSTDRVKVTLTLKQNYIPWSINLGSKGFSFEPLSCGIYINTILGRQFWSSSPTDQYSEGEYTTQTEFRFNICIGEKFTYKIPENKRFFAKSVSIFYEISTNDWYLTNAVQNSYLKPKDYLHLSLGAKFRFF